MSPSPSPIHSVMVSSHIMGSWSDG